MRIFSFRLATALTVLLAFCVSILAQNNGFDITRMDNSADACTDFFQYSNGTWLKNTEIPAAYSRWGSFNVLAENNNNTLKGILEDASKSSASAGSDAQLIGDFYAACMDESGIEKAGISPLNSYFKQIDSIKSVKDLQHQIAVMHNLGIPALFGFGGGPDIKNSTTTIANAGQGGLSLPNRDYYTKGDEKSAETRAKFREYMTNMFKLIGDDDDAARQHAFSVMQLQTRLANASKAPVELRNPDARYNKVTLTQAADVTPNFSWTNYMATRNVPTLTEFNLGQPEFFKEVNKMMTEIPLEQWKTYLRWMLINNAAPRLSSTFVNENFNFYGKTLQGTKELQPRWRRCVAATDGTVGEALGQEFVKKAFTPEAKKRMGELIDNLFAAYKERIQELDWMSPETKTKALAKLGTFKRKIGYPDVLKGYAGLKVDRNSYFLNDLRSDEFELKRNIQEINKPVDRTRFGMTPPTVNAYYSGVFNEIVFPAGILQPPFFNFSADDAINYGAIGAVIGHEVTHGFDDQGSKFDFEGNFKNWWTDEDRAKFDERASCVANQFDGYEVAKGLNMNGKLTLGENIADLGGLTMAYNAFEKSLEGKPRPENIDGFTPEQRFFLGWAQVWAAKATPEAERLQVLGDPHALPRWRVNGPLSNLPVFASAFSCKSGDTMVKENSCKIW